MSQIDEDAAKLRILASWFDEHDKKTESPYDEVQQDLRRIANYLSIRVLVGPNRYKQLMEDQDKLTALENAGVDNWDGYDIAMRTLRDDDDDEED